MDAKKIGKTVKVLRTRYGYTQHQLADRLNVTDKAVSKWERGLSVPDISIISQLSDILNIDIDNLLEGNITYLDKSWQGLLVLEENPNRIFSGTQIYDKPLVYILLSYFMLAGIRDIFIDCPGRDCSFIEETLGDGSEVGVRLHFSGSEEAIRTSYNIMVVYGNPFIYGSNLTKHFQRAMSRKNGVTALTIPKRISDADSRVTFDNKMLMPPAAQADIYRLPVLFFPRRFTGYLSKDDTIGTLFTEQLLYAEPMGRGMVCYPIIDQNAVLNTAVFMRYLKDTMGVEIYQIHEIARNRNLIQN